MRRFFRITYYLGGILLFVLIALIGFTQTRSFKAYLRNVLLLQSRSILNGHLQLGTIDGNLITGFVIHEVSIDESGTELFAAEQIELKYDLLGLLFNRVGISDAVIVNPHIHIYRSTRDIWNVGRLLKSAAVDTTPSVWSINIKRIELTNAEIIVTDSLRLLQRQSASRTPSEDGQVQQPDSVIDYARIHLSKFSLIASAQIRNKSYSATITQMRFKSQSPVFALTHFAGSFLLTNNKVSAKNVEIKTLLSHIQLDVGMRDIDLTRISDLAVLRTKPLNLSLSADVINMKELKQFLYPWIDFLDREFTLKVEATGTFGNINVEKAVVQTPQTLIQFQGKLLNLHNPRDLEMDLYSLS